MPRRTEEGGEGQSPPLVYFGSHKKCIYLSIFAPPLSLWTPLTSCLSLIYSTSFLYIECLVIQVNQYFYFQILLFPLSEKEHGKSRIWIFFMKNILCPVVSEDNKFFSCNEFIVFCLTIHQEPEPEPFYF